MSTILIGVDASERSEDAIVFGAPARGGRRRERHRRLRVPLLRRAEPRRERAVPRGAGRGGEGRGAPARSSRTARSGSMANPSPAHALHDLAEAERAALIVVGSTHTGRVGPRPARAAPASGCCTARPARSRSSPRATSGEPIRRIGVAYNATDGGAGRRARRRRAGARARRRARAHRRRLARGLHHAGADGRRRARSCCARTSSATSQDEPRHDAGRRSRPA